ncbi:hypothetical protein NQ315_015431 [Exocentrus adspersus]|uniref:SIAH-type domain-containing protein n=1 Tax=Exocentrus adspersus TaxID=1586481 RepID=A0AAV8VLV0_9CUCU|nr:hypothetical protein NQ315_015431 [Exocentrus adspersus]
MVIYLCPADRKYVCSWEGHSSDILDHFEKEHDDLLFYTNTVEIDLKTSSENRLFFIDEEIYLGQTKIQDNVLGIYLRYLGPEKLATKITYTINLRSGNDLISPEHVSVSEKGCLEVKLKSLEELYSEVERLQCTFNITKGFGSNSSDDGVFLEDDLLHQEGLYFPHMPLLRKRSFDDGKYRSSISQSSENDVQESSLTRSKTINYEEIKRRNIIKRAGSTISLGAIQETDSGLNCTNCGVILVPPIFLCPCGHNFCLKCKGGICQLCSEEITDERNAELEEKYNKYLHPCRYKKMGCPQKLVYSELQGHEVSCAFCEYKCPMDECSFVAQFKGMSKHLKLIHGSTKILEAFIMFFQNTSEAFLVNEERGIFYCYVKYFPDSVMWEAKFCGPKERRFFCELKFKEGKLKKPLLLRKIENTYSVRMSFQELKRLKLKSKNAILTITC